MRRGIPPAAEIEVTVEAVRFTPAPEYLVRTGLLGFVTCTIGPLRIGGLALRRTSAGHITVAYPERRGRGGRRHALVRPASRATQRAIEDAVLAALGDALEEHECTGPLTTLTQREPNKASGKNTGGTVPTDIRPDAKSGVTSNAEERS